MVVEGFRRSDEDVMDAYQYFHENDQVVGKSQVGTMEYDATTDGARRARQGSVPLCRRGAPNPGSRVSGGRGTAPAAREGIDYRLTSGPSRPPP